MTFNQFSKKLFMFSTLSIQPGYLCHLMHFTLHAIPQPGYLCHLIHFTLHAIPLYGQHIPSFNGSGPYWKCLVSGLTWWMGNYLIKWFKQLEHPLPAPGWSQCGGENDHFAHRLLREQQRHHWFAGIWWLDCNVWLIRTWLVVWNIFPYWG